MRRKMMAAGFALAVAIPAAAQAQTTCEQRAQNRVAGTVIGGVVGALAGSAVAGHGHKSDGAVVGGIAGAVIGNQAAKGPKDCQHAYGWYDNDNRWHANNVDPNVAYGYYDRRGEWIDGRPADYRPIQYRPDERRDYRDDRRAGDWDDPHAFDRPGFPELANQEQRIRDMLRDGIRDNRIDRDEARSLFGELRDIRADEVRMLESRYVRRDDRERLRMRLRGLERRVERAMRYRNRY
jgi:hypothetical protein